MQNKSLIKNTLYTILKTFATIVIPFMVFPYISRILNVDSIGKWNYANSYISYFMLFAMFGVSEYATRNGSRIKDNKDEFNRFSNQIFSVNLIFSIASFILLVAFAFLLSFLEQYRAIIIFLGITVLIAPFSVEWIFSVHEDFKYISIRTIVLQIIYACSIFIFIKTEQDFFKYVFISVLASVITTVFNYHRSGIYHRPKFTFNNKIKEHFKNLSVFFINSLASAIYLNSDVLILGYLTNNYTVGLYSAAVKIYSMVKQLFNATVFSMIPRLSYYAINSHSEFKKLLRNVVSIVFVFVFPATIGLITLSNDVIILIAGPKYQSASMTLSILAVATFFAVYANIFANGVMIPMGKEKIVAKATIWSAILNLILNIWAIPKFLQNGAAATTLLAEAMLLCICVFQSRNIVIHVVDVKNVISVSFSTLVMVLMILFINNYLISQEIPFIFSLTVKLLTGVVSYFVMLTLTRNTIIREIKSIIKKED